MYLKIRPTQKMKKGMNTSKPHCKASIIVYQRQRHHKGVTPQASVPYDHRRKILSKTLANGVKHHRKTTTKIKRACPPKCKACSKYENRGTTS